MQKIIKRLVFVAILVAILVYFLPISLDNPQDSKSDLQTHKPSIIYKKIINGIAHFSDSKSEDAEVYQSKNPVQYILDKTPATNNNHDNEIAQNERDISNSIINEHTNHTNKPTTKLDAVLDPINSINREAAREVEKIRHVERERQAKQGI